MSGLRIILGADEAGVDYKDAVVADLEADKVLTDHEGC